MRYYALLLLILLSCAPVAQDAVTKPVTDREIAEPKAEPVLDSEVKPAPQMVEKAEEPVQEPVVEAPEPEPQEEPAFQQSPLQACIEDCEGKCSATAQNSCTQKERSLCRQYCGDNEIIDPSACTQAFAYLGQPNVCKQQMEKFCSAQCDKYCH